MKKATSIGLLAILIVVGGVALCHTLAEPVLPPAPALVPTLPDSRTQVRPREPACRAPQAMPNVAGEVSDVEGRLLSGIPVVAVDPTGDVLGQATSGEDGRFEMLIRAGPPVTVELASAADSVKLSSLPRLDVELSALTPDRESDELSLRIDLLAAAPDEAVAITLYDSLGDEVRTFRRRLSESPYHFPHIPYGAYDIRVSGETRAGAVFGFDFSPENRTAVAVVGPAARVRGDLSRPAEAVIIARSSTRVPVARWLRTADGRMGLIRGVWNSSRGRDGSRKLASFDYPGLPPGEFLLRFLGAGVETLEIPLTLAPGVDRDLGLIEIEEARGDLTLRLRDREGDLEFGYRVTLYSHAGLRFVREAAPGSSGHVRFDRLPAGRFRYRSERKLGPGHTRSTGRDPEVEVGKDESKTVEVDCRWR